MNNQSLNLKTLEIWTGSKVDEHFDPISATIAYQENKERIFTKIHIAQKEITEILNSRFLHWGKIRRITIQTYYDAGFIARTIR